MARIFRQSYLSSLPSGQLLTRASIATYINSQNEIVLAAVDQPRFEAAGLLLEPAATQAVPSPANPAGSDWRENGATVTALSPVLWGTFDGVSVQSNGGDGHRISSDIVSLTLNESRPFSAVISDGDTNPSGQYRLNIEQSGGSAQSRVLGTFDASPEVILTTAGLISDLSETALSEGVYLLTGTITPALTGNFEFRVGPNSATSGEQINLFGVDLSNLDRQSSFIPGGSRGADSLSTIQLSSTAAALPPNFPWDHARYPLELGGTIYSPTVSIVPRDIVDDAIFTGNTYYANSSQSDNSGDGLSAATAKRSINACIALGNAAGQPYQVVIQAGDYFAADGINGISGNVEPSQPCAFIAAGGTARIVAAVDEVFSVHSGDTYASDHSLTGRVFDRSALDADGVYVELVEAASVADCIATANSWVLSGGRTYIHRSDSAPPTPANTLVVESRNNCRFDTHQEDVYFEGLVVEGGLGGALDLATNVTRDRRVGALDCHFSYGGVIATPLRNGVDVDNASGFMFMKNCQSHSSSKDGFGFHENTSGPGFYLLLVGCKSRRNGVPGATSINAHTLHDSIVGLDLNGDYAGGGIDGQVAANIESSQACFMGSRIELLSSFDAADYAVRTQNGANSWLYGCTIVSDDKAIIADPGGAVEYQLTSITGTVTGDVTEALPNNYLAEGTLVFSFRTPYGRATNNQLVRMVGGSDSLIVRTTGNAAIGDIVVKDNGVDIADSANYTFGDLTARNVIAVAWNPSGIRWSWNGEEVQSLAADLSPLEPFRDIEIPDVKDPTHLDYLAVFDTVLSDTEMQIQSAAPLGGHSLGRSTTNLSIGLSL